MPPLERAAAEPFPRSPHDRSTRETPNFSPAASSHLRRSHSVWPPHRPTKDGFGVAESFEGLLAGRSGIAPTDDAAFDSGGALSALVERPYLRVDPPGDLRTQMKFLNGAGELAVQAAHEAHDGSGWADAECPPDECGLWTSQLDTDDWACGFLRPAMAEATEGYTRPLDPELLNRSGVRRTVPFFLLDSLKNNAFSFIANWWRATSPNGRRFLSIGCTCNSAIPFERPSARDQTLGSPARCANHREQPSQYARASPSPWSTSARRESRHRCWSPRSSLGQ